MKIFFSLFLMLVPAKTLFAETQWLLGAGLGHISANAYVGSSNSVALSTPIPFFKINTDLFDISKSDMQMKWFEQTPFRLSINYDFSLPVDSDEVSLRKDMSDLDPVLKIGPMLSYQLYDSADWNWKLELPVLYAYKANDLNLKSIGWNFSPGVSANLALNHAKSALNLSWSLRLMYGNQTYHQFYYSVNQSDATTDRSEYQAKQGYAGYGMNLSMTKRLNNLWFGLYLRYQNLSDAVFADSSLVDQEDYWLVTFGMSWLFAGNM